MYQCNSKIIELNVGGQKLTTSYATLIKHKGSVLEAMFSGRHSLSHHKKRIFIDRDPSPFKKMLSYLRTGLKPSFEDDPQNFKSHLGNICSKEVMFYRELDFWQVPAPEKICRFGYDDLYLNNQIEYNSFDPEWAASTVQIEGPEGRTVRKRNHSDEHGIVYCKKPLDA